MFKAFKTLLFKKSYVNGDWGLGIGDWAQSPIPNPQSPNIQIFIIFKLKIIN